ncbi:SRPBCC family protein, partial [Staphylococcus warneri]
MAKYNVENEYVEIDIERLLKYSPETIYEAWTKEDILKQWFMTSKRTNKSFEADVQEGGKYRIVDSRNGKQNIIEGTYEELVMDEFIKMTIGMPGLSNEEDI